MEVTHGVESMDTIEMEVSEEELHGGGEETPAHEVNDDINDVLRDILFVFSGVYHPYAGCVVAQLNRHDMRRGRRTIGCDLEDLETLVSL